MNVLILLIGGNPLPNYVVAKYLLTSDRDDAEKLPAPDRVILVYSERTERFALKIIEQLQLDGKAEKVNLQKGERQPEIISEKIQKKLDKLAANASIETLHLNYTGGTKSMSVRGYIAITEWIEKRNNQHIPLIISDLDPDNHKIVRKDSTDCYPIGNTDLLDSIKLTMEKLFDLHHMHILKPGRGTPVNTEILYKVASYVIAEKQGKRARDISFEKRFKRFFDNDVWLEYFVFQCLIELQKNPLLKLHEIRRGVEASPYGEEDQKERRTEIDVIAVRGYQLFLISCTVSKDMGTVKKKAFEALFRAEELGGEHANVVVVCFLPPEALPDQQDRSIKQLCKDLQQFRAVRNCYLIGIDVLEEEAEGKGTLTQRLKEIILGERKWELQEC